jgi:hypothetical protein
VRPEDLGLNRCCRATEPKEEAMSETSQSFRTRLMRLPRQLLLALVNAAALLVIVACVLALLVLNRAETAGERIAGAATDAALARLQVSPEDFGERLERLDEQLETLNARLSDPGLKDHWEITQQLKDLNRSLSGISRAAEGLSAAGPDVAAAAFDQAGDTLTDALYVLRGCRSAPRPDLPAN